MTTADHRVVTGDSVHPPRLPFTIQTSSSPTEIMSYNTHRTLSPGGRRIANQGRLSDNSINDLSYSQRQQAYISPRSSGGVIPISTQTFINVPPPSGTRPPESYESPKGRSRRSSLVDSARGSGNTVNKLPSRSRPNVVQNDVGRQSSPNKPSRDKDYYVTPASSQEPRTHHKKLYSVDDGTAKLVGEMPVQSGGDRHHSRKDTGEREYRTSDAGKDRRRRSYVPGSQSRPKDKSIDDDDAYSYTDPASMYKETEPRWREVRPRRGSLDRAGPNRDRALNYLDPGYDPHKSSKETIPPPNDRGPDRSNGHLGRTRSVRDPQQEMSPSPTRGRGYTDTGAYGDPRDAYYVSPRTYSPERKNSALPPDRYDTYPHGEYQEPKKRERRNSATRVSHPERSDRSVERRGFGIRNDFANNSRDHYGRGSDESFENYRSRGSRDDAFHRHNSLPVSDDLQWEHESREKEHRHRDDDYAYERERDRESERPRDRDHDYTRERDRDRTRQADYPSDHGRDRHHHRRNTADDSKRDRDYYRKENSPQPVVQSPMELSAAETAAGGFAGAAAVLGASGLVSKSDKKEREPQQDREDHERTRDRRPGQAASDEPYYEREQDHDRHRDLDSDRGLGFAFEAPPEPPKSAPPTNNDSAHEITSPRDSDRDRDHKPVEMPIPTMDPEEDYRRRMEQVQRELGLRPEEHRNSTDDDADRERRRREREQRQRERDYRGSGGSSAAAVSSPDLGTGDGHSSSTLRQNFDDEQSSFAGTTRDMSPVQSDPRRRSSALENPVTNGGAHIIDNSQSERRENRVRIVDPPAEEEERRPKGILKKPTEKFPEHSNNIREGVAPLKDVSFPFPYPVELFLYPFCFLLTILIIRSQATKKGIPPGARWTKIDRRLVNPEALEAAQERFEERLDHVIVLRVLTKEEIQKLADRTREIRGKRHSFYHSVVSRGGDDLMEEGEDYPSSSNDYFRDEPHILSSSRHDQHDSIFRHSHRVSGVEHERQRRPHHLKRHPWTFQLGQSLRDILIHSLTHHSPPDERHEEERAERKAARRRDRKHDRHDHDEYSDDSENEFAPRAPKLLEDTSTTASSTTATRSSVGGGGSGSGSVGGAGTSDGGDYVRDRRRDRDRETDSSYTMSGGLGRRE